MVNLPTFFVPTLGDFTAQESPPREFAIQGKKNVNARGEGLGAAGIDRYIMYTQESVGLFLISL